MMIFSSRVLAFELLAFFSTLFLHSHLVLDLLFFSSCKELVLLLFVFFFPQRGKKKKTRYDGEWEKEKEWVRRILRLGDSNEEEALLWLLTQRVYDDDFSSENASQFTHRKRKQAKWKIYFSHKAKNKKKENKR